MIIASLISLLSLSVINAASEAPHKVAPKPLDSVIITSERATGTKQQDGCLHVVYEGGVVITLADGTVGKSATLTADLETDSTKRTSKNPLRKAVLNTSVVITQKDRTLEADVADINPLTTECTLTGHVVLRHSPTPDPLIPKNRGAPPFVTQGERAVFNITTGTINIEGSAAAPVKTVIDCSRLAKGEAVTSPKAHKKAKVQA